MIRDDSLKIKCLKNKPRLMSKINNLLKPKTTLPSFENSVRIKWSYLSNLKKIPIPKQLKLKRKLRKTANKESFMKVSCVS